MWGLSPWPLGDLWVSCRTLLFNDFYPRTVASEASKRRREEQTESLLAWVWVLDWFNIHCNSHAMQSRTNKFFAYYTWTLNRARVKSVYLCGGLATFELLLGWCHNANTLESFSSVLTFFCVSPFRMRDVCTGVSRGSLCGTVHSSVRNKPLAILCLE